MHLDLPLDSGQVRHDSDQSGVHLLSVWVRIVQSKGLHTSLFANVGIHIDIA